MIHESLSQATQFMPNTTPAVMADDMLGEPDLPLPTSTCINKTLRDNINTLFGVNEDDWMTKGCVERLVDYPTFAIYRGIIVTPTISFDGKDAYTSDGLKLEILDDVLTVEALVDEAQHEQKNAKKEIDRLAQLYHTINIVWKSDTHAVVKISRRFTIIICLVGPTLVYLSFFYITDTDMITSSFIASNNQIESTINKLLS